METPSKPGPFDNIEIVEFYKHKQSNSLKDIFGTIHVYLPDFNLDIRGINIRYKPKETYNKRISVSMPFKTDLDPEEKGGKIKYPIFHFTDRTVQNQFVKAVRKKARRYIKDEYKISEGEPKDPNKTPKSDELRKKWIPKKELNKNVGGRPTILKKY